MKIKGIDYKVNFGLNQSILYCELRDIDITQMNDELSNLAGGSGSAMRDLIWSALKDGARKAGTAFPHDNMWVGDMLQELDEGAMTSFVEDMVATLPKPEKNPSKKKVQK